MPKIRGMHAATFLEACRVGSRRLPSPRHVFVCVADHFEPDWKNASKEVQEERVRRWTTNYPLMFQEFQDSRGRPPQHSFFSPIEVYDPHQIEALCSLVRQGYGDIEIHLHHDNDCSHQLKQTLEVARQTFFSQHGLLSKDSRGEIRFGFIHGNWALDNSHPDGRWCGVNNEISVLLDTGCYADFTMPAAPHPAQTRQINSIYYAVDDPSRPKSHDRGVPAERSKAPPSKSLLLIQGPLSVIIDRHGWIPRMRIENGNLSDSQQPDARRISNWLKASVSVVNRPDWLFVKLHTHGAKESNAAVLLGEPMRQLHQGFRLHSLEHDYQYYYVTAREMAQLVQQAESGLETPDFDSLSFS